MELGMVVLYAIVVLRLPMWMSIGTSWLHCAQEVVGDLPSYFATLHNCYRDRDARLVLTLQHAAAVLTFGPGLAAVLTVLAMIGYADMSDEPNSGSVASIGLAALCGARLGDSVLSHLLLAFYKRPNPGLPSCVGYICEGLLLLLYVKWGAAEAVAALIAVGGFWAVNPIFGLIGLRIAHATSEERTR